MPGGSAHFMTSTAGGTQGSSSYGGGGGGSAPPGEQGGGGYKPPEEQDWIGQSQDTETYYGSGGQGTTNVNLNPTQDQVAQVAQQAFEIQKRKQEELERKQAQEAKEALEREQGKKQGIISKYLHGEVLDDYVGDKNWVTPKGQHKLRSQYDRLLAKYGPGFADTEQAKVLANYLSGVAVERGGGLGAYDKSAIGSTNWEEVPQIDPVTKKYRSKEERQAIADAAKYRENLLSGIASVDLDDLERKGGSLYSGMDIDKLRLGLSPDQYFNFRQQLMAADPSAGNQLYKDAFPWSSGSGVKSLTRFLPGMGAAQTFLGGLLPEQSEWGDWKANQRIFEDTSTPVYGQGDGGGVMNAWQNPYDKWKDAEAEIPEEEDEDEDDVVDLTPTPTPYPVYGEGIAGLDWSQFGPHFGPQYPGHYSHWGSGYANGGIVRLLNQYG